jgi:hypothetical protein
MAKRKKRQEEFWSRKQHEQDLARTSPASNPRDWTPEPNSQELLPTSPEPAPDLSMDLFLLDRKYMFLEDDHREAVCKVERLQQELEASRRRSDFAILTLRNQLKEKTRNPHGVKLRPTEEELELEAVERRNSSTIIRRNLNRQQQQRTLNSVSKLLRARERRCCGGPQDSDSSE